MNERDGYIPGVPCWVDTSQPEPEAVLEFYAGLFGWEFEDVMPPGSPAKYFIGRLRGRDVAAVGSQREGAAAAAWNTYIWVESADEAAAQARAAGGSVLTDPFDVGESGRMAVLADREGAAFCAWQPGRHRGAGLVNEPGTLNFNDLSCRDLGAAKAFYGALFGWQVLDLGGGGTLWMLPGYCDHLEQSDPGLRERMTGGGAPEGFEDVVASARTIEDDGTPAHWGVTFAVADADATAEKAAQLGGRVEVQPFDAPWVRMTVITDPGGATFTASQFVPENRDLAAEAGAATGSS